MSQIDQLWTPLLTHYRQGAASIELDAVRMAAQVMAVKPSISQYLIAGSTGDGWEMATGQLVELVQSLSHPAYQGCRMMIGALAGSTGEVIEKARAVEDTLKAMRLEGAVVEALTICPPINPLATQAEIETHYAEVLQATTLPIAIYELPQVTGCSLEPETVARLAQDPRAIYFKDTSGADRVATARVPNITLLRGAEGAYHAALSGRTGYHGVLLSTGNTVGACLRRIAELGAQDPDQAQTLSDELQQVVEMLFGAAADLPFGNPFSNANRALDHILAYGADWRSAEAPLTISGNRLPLALLERAAEAAARLGLDAGRYLSA